MTHEQDWIEIVEDGDYITSKMPADETIVEVMLDDGSITRSWYATNISEPGDYDFSPVGEDGGPTDESIADRVKAWRPIHA
jgi:hypothetical protein